MKKALLVALLVCQTCSAHEFWIEPSSYRPAPGDTLSLRLLVGVGVVGDALANIPEWYTRFEARGPEGPGKVEGDLGDEPAGRLRISAAGTWLVGYQSTIRRAEIPVAKFNTYLHDAGLDRIAKLRAERGHQQRVGREAYTRFAKTLVHTPGAPFNPEMAGARFGFELEIVPLADPRALEDGGLPVQLLFRGAPLAGALVIALQKDRKDRIEQRTDQQGRAVLALDGPGPWLLNAVHMLEVEGTLADWESYWASLTLSLTTD
ncbi:MAG: DUF4198 domain-containing protein [Gammaproteobacteria bacterium]|nr:DUF4198 domain-containing protein [Gammaproteobacteria bacterium]